MELGLALDLVPRHPRVWQQMDQGHLDVPKAKVIVNGTGHLAIETAREVVDQVITDAPRLTTGQLRAQIAKLCMTVDPPTSQD